VSRNRVRRLYIVGGVENLATSKMIPKKNKAQSSKKPKQKIELVKIGKKSK